jgi:hypothetical protein
MVPDALVPPAPGGAPAALQLPLGGAYGGSLTAWILEDSASASPDDIIALFTTIFARYEALAAVDGDGYECVFRALVDEVLHSVDLSTCHGRLDFA